MALLAAGSLANIYGSLDAYAQEHLVNAAGLTVRLHGTRRFVPPTDTAWAELHYDFLGLQSEYRRQTGRWQDLVLVHATERQGNLQCNIYQRARFWGTRVTLATARDAVIGAFPEGRVIPIYDYSVPETPAVGALILDGTQEHTEDHGMQSGVLQHIVQIRTRYLEHFTR